jgi:hypothetical protein
MTPSALLVRSLLVSTDVAGTGAGAVIDWVVDELELEDWARAAPVTNPNAIITASKDLSISCSPGRARTEVRRGLSNQISPGGDLR